MFFLIPYRNDREISLFPAVTYALIAANICLYIVLLPIDRTILANMMGFTPAHLSLQHIVSSMFVHGGLLHLAWNMLFLWLFGPNVEDALGHIEFAILYLGSGIAAALLQWGIAHALLPSAELVPVIGASGAIAGILGVFAVRFFRTGIRVFYFLGIKWGTFTVPAMWGLGVWFAQQLAGGVINIANQGSGGVAYWSHIGGMLFGMALAYGLCMSHEGSCEYLREDVQKSAADQAVLRLEKALENDPENADMRIELARVFVQSENRERATGNFREGIGIYLGKGERDQATAALAELRHHYRDSMLGPRPEYQIARYLLEAQCHESALKMLDSLSAAYPDAPEAQLSLMIAGDLCLYTLNDLDGALGRYESFESRYPESHLCVMVEKSLKEVREKLRVLESRGPPSS